mgnify:CR=1 FL=1
MKRTNTPSADRPTREFRRQAMDAGVVQRRHLAVLLRAQALQPCLSGMHGEAFTASSRHRLDKVDERLPFRLVIDRDPVLDRHRYVNRAAHGGHAVGDKLRFGHQAGPEPTRLDPVGRTPDVQVDLVISVIYTDHCALRERRRVGAAELQRNGMLGRIEGEQPVARPMQDRAGGHHLGVEPHTGAYLTQEKSLVTVGPVHHRRNGEPHGL